MNVSQSSRKSGALGTIAFACAATVLTACGGANGASTPATESCSTKVPQAALLYPMPKAKGVATSDLTVVVAHDPDPLYISTFYIIDSNTRWSAHSFSATVPSPLPTPAGARPRGTKLEAFNIPRLLPKTTYTVGIMSNDVLCASGRPWEKNLGSFRTQ